MLRERPETVKQAEEHIQKQMNANIKAVEDGKHFMKNKKQQKQLEAEAYTIPLEVWGVKPL